MAACVKMSVAPRLAGCSGLPSILVGCPMWLSTSTGCAMPAERDGAREEQRTARDEVLGLPDVGDDLFRRLLRAGADAGERERRAHQLQELAAALRIVPLATPARGTPGAGTRGTAACRPARRGCASTGAPRRRPDGIECGSMSQLSASSSSFQSPVPRSGWQLAAGSWSLPVARRAARQLFDARDLVFLHQALAEAGVVGRALPGHVEDLIARPDVLRRVPVAVQAPASSASVFSWYMSGILSTRPVAGRAADALVSRGCCG